METLHYAAILLLVFGIIEVYSFKPTADSTDYAVSEDNGHESDLQVVAPAHQGFGRIKREKTGFSEDQKKKTARLAELAARAAADDRRRQAVQRQVAEHRSAGDRYENLIDGYMQRGYNRAAAIAITDIRNPGLAAQMHPPNRGS